MAKATDAFKALAEERAEFIERFVPLYQFYQYNRLAPTPNPYRMALALAGSGKSLEQIKGALLEQMGKGVDIAGCKDLLAFIDTGKPWMPKDLYDLPKFWADEQKKADKELEKKFADTRAAQDAERVRKEKEEKKQKRQALAAELGIDPNKLEGLKEEEEIAAPPES